MLDYLLSNPLWILYWCGGIVVILLCSVNSVKFKRKIIGSVAMTSVLSVFWPVAALVGLGIVCFLVFSELP